MDRAGFDLSKLDSWYLMDRSGTHMDIDDADRLDLWCEDLKKAMEPGVSDSVSMAKRTTSLWRELGTIWPAGDNDGIRGAQRDMLQAVMESKGFTVGGKQFEETFDKAMDGTAGPNGYLNLYKSIAGGISGDGVTRDGYGRELYPGNGRPMSMRFLPPGGYAGAMKRDNERIRQGLGVELFPGKSVDPEPTGAAAEAVKKPADPGPKKPGALSRLMSMLGRDGRDDAVDRSGPEF